jgi:RimJ/RimL family protein N-acetyltransferase
MQLLPLNTPELLNTVAGWLNDSANYRWLDFGNGVQSLSPALLKIMSQKDTHVLRAFTADDNHTPIGVVGLSNVDRNFRTATIWVALGDTRFSARGYPLRASSKMLLLAFRELALNVVQAWCVECNHASARIIRLLNFQPIGRQRQCHRIDGRIYDRLWFDMLPSEFREINDD